MDRDAWTERKEYPTPPAPLQWLALELGRPKSNGSTMPACLLLASLDSGDWNGLLVGCEDETDIDACDPSQSEQRTGYIAVPRKARGLGNDKHHLQPVPHDTIRLFR